MDPIDQTLAVADKQWRAYGVRSADRAALASDLRLDLESAAADGVTPAQLLGEDIRSFARRLADEAGVRTVPPAYGQVVGTALIGSIVGGAVGFVLFLLVFAAAVRMIDLPRTWHVPIQLAMAVYYGIPGLIVVAGAVATVRVRLRGLPLVRPTARAMCLLLPLAAAIITPTTIWYAWTTNYSSSPQVVLSEAFLVIAALGGAAALARRWALREPKMSYPRSTMAA